MNPTSENHTPASPRPSRRRRRHRGARRATERDASWLADELSRSAKSPLGQARSFMRIADEVLKTIEGVAWEVRGIAQSTGDVWQEVRGEAEDLAGGLADARQRAAGAPDKYKRLASTAVMLGQVALGYRLHTFRSAFMSREAAARSLDSVHARSAQRFYRTSVAQGGAFLKVGQLLSARHDLLPEAWLAELGKLQDDVPALPFEPIREALEADLGALTERFAELDETPVAAASIGQVHRGVTHDGVTVAVKVQRPGVAALIETDLALLDLFIDGVRSMLPPTDIETIRVETREVLGQETNYALERENMAAAADFFRDHPSIVVPDTVDDLCTDRVLTSRFVEGRKITVVLDELAAARDAGDEAAGPRLDRVMGLLLEAYLRMVLEAGVFQADPHPGNLLVTADDRVVVLDFGAARRMDDDTRRGYLELLAAFVFDDRELLVRRLESLGFRTRSGKPDTLLAFADALLAEMRHAVQSNEPFTWPSKEQLLEQAAGLLRQADADPVTTLPPEFVMIGRVFGTLGGLFGHYRPHVDVATALMPVVGKALTTLQAGA